MKRFLLLILISSFAIKGFSQNHFEVDYTGQPQTYMNVYIFEASIGGTNLSANDEIAVFDGNICCGVAKLDDSFSGPLPISAAKAEGAGTGYTEGNDILVKIWDASESIEYSASVEFRDGSPYNVFTDNESAYINILAKTELTIQLTAEDKEYDGTVDAVVDYSVSGGTVAGDVTINATNGQFSDENAGVEKTVTADITISGNDKENYNFTVIESAKADIQKKSVTISNAAAQDKVYDGTAVAVITGASLTGVVSPDVVNLSNASTGTFEQTDAGTGIPVTTLMGLTGTDADNYTLSEQPAGLVANITAASLTVTADNQNVTYTGQEFTSFTASFEGFVAGDNESDLEGTLTYATDPVRPAVDAGNYTIIPSGLTSFNYSLNYENGTLTIAKADANISVTAFNVIYDGQSHTSTFTAVGVETEPVDLSDLMDVSATTHTTAGNYDDSWSFAGNSNYNAANGDVENIIEQVELYVTGVEVSNKIYDGDYDAELSGAVLNEDGLVGDDEVVLTNTSTGRFAQRNAGTNISVSTSFVLDGSDAENYKIVQPGGLAASITKRELTAKANNQSRAYGELNPDFTISYTGFINGDNSSNLNSSPNVHSEAVETSNVGTYPILIEGGNDNNYYFDFEPGVLTINKATATVTFDSLLVAYTGNPRPAKVITEPAELAVDVTYDGNQEAPTELGDYTVKAVVNETNYEGEAEGVLRILEDNDGDGQPDLLDNDSDGDGVTNDKDAFPNDPSEDTDSDGDGVGDNADAFPNDPNQTTDTTAPQIDETNKVSLTIVCGSDFEQELNQWLQENAGAIANDDYGVKSWSHDFTNDMIDGGCLADDTILVTFTVEDYFNNFSITTAELVVKANEAPYLIQPVADQTVNVSYELSIPLSSFSGDIFGDVNDSVLQLSVMVEGTDTLPGWAEFINDTLQLTPMLADTGCYSMVVEASDGELTATDTFQVCVEGYPTAIDDIGAGQFEVNLYPNPTQGMVNIDIESSTARDIELTVLDITGKQVLRKQFRAAERITFDMSGKVSGMYFVKLEFEGKQVLKKLVVDRK